jgi:hypothetical protein
LDEMEITLFWRKKNNEAGFSFRSLAAWRVAR